MMALPWELADGRELAERRRRLFSLSPIQSGSLILNPTVVIRKYRFVRNFVKETLSF
jgi:hypothetical protein